MICDPRVWFAGLRSLLYEPEGPGSRLRPNVRRAITVVVLLVLGVPAVAWVVERSREHRIEPGRAPEPPDLAAPARTAPAVRAEVAVFEESVGTVQSRTRVAVAAQVSGRVIEVTAPAGSTIRQNDLLVSLEDRELSARYDQARSQYERIKGFLAKQAATQQQMEEAEAAYLQAKAALDQTRIMAPISGIVAERLVEPGDMAWPGRTLLVVHDPGALRLEAQVRESLIAKVTRGSFLEIDLPALARTVRGTVAEIIPSADPQSRSFTVWVNLDSAEGVYPGMFGRLRIEVGRRKIVQSPREAVVRVGQLETVVVRDGVRWRRRLVTTGALLPEGAVEILSGLEGEETLGVFGEATR